MLQHLNQPLQPLPASRNGWQHNINLMIRRLSLQDDGGWDYEGKQKFLIDDTDDQILESSLTPARAVRE